MKIKIFFKKHYLAVIFAVLVGLIIIWPYFYFIYQTGENYKSFNFLASEGEVYYSERTREAYDGHLKISDPAHYEYKNNPYLQPGLGEIIVAALAKVFHLSIPQMFWVGDFIFPFFLFLVLYWLFFQISRLKIVSLVASWFIILGTNFIFFPQEFINFILGDFSYLNYSESFLLYSRSIHPQVSSLIFFLWLVLFYQYYKDINFNRLKLFLVTILFGALAYSYIYTFLLAMVLVGLAFLINLFRINWYKIKQLIFIIIGGFIILIPYLLDIYQLNFSMSSARGFESRGFYFSHRFFWSNLLFLDLVMILFLYFWQRRKKDINFLILIIFSLFISFNQQVISGIIFYPGHWHWYYSTPLFIFISLMFFYYLLDKLFSKNILYLFFITIFILVFINAIMIQYDSYGDNFSKYLSYQRYIKVYQWLNNNTEKDSVVLSLERIPFSSFITTFTHNNLYQNTSSAIYLRPKERLNHNYFVQLYLKDINPKEIDDYLKKNIDEFQDILEISYPKKRYSCSSCSFNEEINKLANDYKEFYYQDFEKNLKKYRLDYVLNDEKSLTSWNLEKFDFLQLITKINSIGIYKVI